MIEEYEKLAFPSENKTSKPIVAEVNWEDNPETNECKIIKFTFPDGTQSFVKKEHFISFLFMIGKPEEQRKMIPETLTTVRFVEKIYTLKANRNIAKGDEFTVPVRIPLPVTKEEVYEAIKKKNTGIIKSKVGV